MSQAVVPHWGLYTCADYGFAFTRYNKQQLFKQLNNLCELFLSLLLVLEREFSMKIALQVTIDEQVNTKKTAWFKAIIDMIQVECHYQPLTYR